MLRMGMLTGLMALLITAGPAVPVSASAQEQAPTTTSPSTRRGKMDPSHPLRIGANYYPKESLKHHEEGRCILAFYINTDGSVAAAQLLKSSGYSRLDIACIEAAIDVPLLPAIVDGTPVAGWSDFNLVWVIDHAQPHPPAQERSVFPRVADDYELQAGAKHYPEAARAKHERGYCVVHTTVGSAGAVLNAAITRSTGSATLDQACLAAVKDARFTPEIQDSQPVADSTDIAIYW